MTLQNLIDELTNIEPKSARTANVFLYCGEKDIDLEIASVRYEMGEVVIEVEER